MNNRKMNNKVRDDTAAVVNDVSTLAGDTAARFGRFEDDVNQAAGKAKADMTSWAADYLSQMSKGIEKLSVDARDTAVTAAASAKKNIGYGLSQYNSKVQELADKAPGGLSEQAAKYPWVALSITVIIGFLLGMFIRPARPTYR